jgi:GIY-YIG catalytic domain.
MLFADLLRSVPLDPTRTALALHKPGSAAQRLRLLTLRETRPDLFEAYQGTHPALQEATLKARAFLASFIARGEGELVFAGLFAQEGWVDLTGAELDALPAQRELRATLAKFSFAEEAARKGVRGRALFTLRPMEALADLIGRLVVADPGGRNHMRRAETTPLRVAEVTRLATLVPPLPHWTQVVLGADEVLDMPRDWELQIAQWRGIYLIVDEKDGARYVGSAYGAENLLGRWRAHVAGDYGVTRELSLRRTGSFRFSILELTSPAADATEVIRLEQIWMERLHTRRFGLNA